MYMGDLFTICFGPKGPSPGNTFIKITQKSYWVMSGVYMCVYIYIYISFQCKPLTLYLYNIMNQCKNKREVEYKRFFGSQLI